MHLITYTSKRHTCPSKVRGNVLKLKKSLTKSALLNPRWSVRLMICQLLLGLKTWSALSFSIKSANEIDVIRPQRRLNTNVRSRTALLNLSYCKTNLRLWTADWALNRDRPCNQHKSQRSCNKYWIRVSAGGRSRLAAFSRLMNH